MNYKKIILLVSFLAVLGLLVNFGAPTAKATTVAEIQALIQQLQAQIAALQKQLAETQDTTAVWCHDFNTNLRIGDSGSEIEALQTALTKDGSTVWEYKGFDGIFDEMIAGEVVGFQEKYASEILAPWGLKHGTGFVGKSTRAKLNALYGCGLVTVVTPPLVTPPTKKSITVISPNGGEKWQIGNTYQVNLYCSQGISKVLNISLINYATGGGETEIVHEVTCRLGATSGYNWMIPSFITTGSQFKVVAKTIDNLISDQSDDYFSIIAAPVACTDSDGGFNYYTKGTTKGMAADGTIVTEVDYCTTCGTETTNSSCVVEWGCAGSYRINTNFTCPFGCQNGACLPAPSITVTNPNIGGTFLNGSTMRIEWTYLPLPPDKFAINLLSGSQDVAAAHLKYCDTNYTQSSIAEKYFSWDWRVGYDADDKEIPLGAYRIYVYNCGNVGDASDVPFSTADGLGSNDIENQLASIAEAISQLMESAKELLKR